MGTHLGLWEYEGGEGQSVAAMEGQQEGMQRTGTLGRSWAGPVLFQPVCVCSRAGGDRTHSTGQGLWRPPRTRRRHHKGPEGRAQHFLVPRLAGERGSEGNSGH